MKTLEKIQMYLATVIIGLSALAHAQERPSLAVGIAPSAYQLSDASWGFAPEIFGQTYLHMSGPIFLRGGARLGGRGLIQPTMSTDVRLEERDFTMAAELGIVRNGFVIPSFTIQTGVAHRSFRVGYGTTDSSMSMIGRSEWLPTISAQAGMGLPFARSIVVEPFVRYEYIVDDDRRGLRWGLEMSIGW
jgi:hypothetical protein